ncbi:uncharacterized protein LOC122575485 isoform X1 [Bombus pyrosoma]|uniref:uncharacterized protein LOC122575485 isoform X1 n=1 Tax=Bombus pyrosoma TaxID=396416 RepID=UPI001CB90482|nr:uncharacterized protein LOC122575485 isoform X1 [Bombus pyrosoma]XP_043600441.1 uncharacterized protein LOC122575485 isoform X1 [Bombus pyrosoma]XP_043600450.1 uncharacterized protein LOC122575485 isoform X1 [Bombus pyrosoma]
MAIPFLLPSEDEAEVQGQELEQLMLALYAALQQVLRNRNDQHPSRNHRLPRRVGDERHPILVDSDLARMPLPDLVLSAVEQLPPAAPQVTVSAPSSPTRDATFQFPESNNDENNVAPVPNPRPRPRRRRLASESGGSAAVKKTSAVKSICKCCCGHIGQAFNGSYWATVGANLRNIADDFHASKTKAAEIEKTRLSAMNPSFANTNNTSESTDSFLSLLIPAPLRETLWTTVALYLGWRLVSRLR